MDAVMRVWLKVADPTALTARETLQRALGFGRVVADVARSEILAFHWPGGDPRATLDRLAVETNLLVNPNKHRWEIALGDDALRPRGNAWVLVYQPGEGGALGRVLADRRLVHGAAPTTRRGVLWELTLAEGTGQPEEVLRDLAVARARKQGLLANPEVENAAVFLEAPSGTRVADILGVAAEGASGAHS
jgi:hypothetical protein